MGGILGLLLGSKKVRKMTGGLVGYGGAAAIGALAHKAYQNWQQGAQVATAPVAAAADLDKVDPNFIPAAAPNSANFSLALIYVGASAVAAVLSYLLIVGPIRRLDFAYLDTTTSDTKGTATEQPA